MTIHVILVNLCLKVARLGTTNTHTTDNVVINKTHKSMSHSITYSQMSRLSFQTNISQLEAWNLPVSNIYLPIYQAGSGWVTVKYFSCCTYCNIKIFSFFFYNITIIYNYKIYNIILISSFFLNNIILYFYNKITIT